MQQQLRLSLPSPAFYALEGRKGKSFFYSPKSHFALGQNLLLLWGTIAWTLLTPFLQQFFFFWLIFSLSPLCKVEENLWRSWNWFATWEELCDLWSCSNKCHMTSSLVFIQWLQDNWWLLMMNHVAQDLLHPCKFLSCFGLINSGTLFMPNLLVGLNCTKLVALGTTSSFCSNLAILFLFFSCCTNFFPTNCLCSFCKVKENLRYGWVCFATQDGLLLQLVEELCDLILSCSKQLSY